MTYLSSNSYDYTPTYDPSKYESIYTPDIAAPASGDPTATSPYAPLSGSGSSDSSSRQDAELGSSSYIGHNEKSRRTMVDEILFNLPSNSELSDYVVTNKLLYLLYNNHILQKNNATPFSSYSTKEIFGE